MHAIDHGILIKYQRKVVQYHDRYGGTSVWPFLYQCHTRARSEIWPLLARDLAALMAPAKIVDVCGLRECRVLPFEDPPLLCARIADLFDQHRLERREAIAVEVRLCRLCALERPFLTCAGLGLRARSRCRRGRGRVPLAQAVDH